MSTARVPPLVIVAVSCLCCLVPGCLPAHTDSPRSDTSALRHDPAADAPPAGEHTNPAAARELTALISRDDPMYPSARECAGCHPQHFEEWSVSPHAYAQLSPVFNAMQSTFVKLSNGTFGDFCIRCHTPVGMAKREPRLVASNYADRHPISLEGITCVVCHRVRHEEGKISGRMELSTGAITDPVVGPGGNANLSAIIEDPAGDYPALLAENADAALGVRIHADIEQMEYLSRPGFCGTCHDVTLADGFRLEEAFSDYKASPAVQRGVSCQDCHMGLVPGVASGYEEAPAAIVANVPTPVRKHTNHMFAGPDHSIIDEIMFPHLGPDALELTPYLQDWQAFGYDEGWGSEAFESSWRQRLLALETSEDRDRANSRFPTVWKDSQDRRRGRKVLERQKTLLERYRQTRLATLRAGYVVGDIVVDRADAAGLRFRVQVRNGTDGHSVPTGFIAERSVFLEVTVTDNAGAVVFRSGDTDENGDVRDLHSLYVHNGELPLDEQLFSLQSKFITRNVRGPEREQVLAVNHSVDPLPFLRPSTLSTVATGRPLGARIHRARIEPQGERWPAYEVDASALTGQPPYRARVRLISGMVPPNLIHDIAGVGFDYGLSPREVAHRIVDGRLVLWDREVVLEVAK